MSQNLIWEIEIEIDRQDQSILTFVIQDGEPDRHLLSHRQHPVDESRQG